MGTFGHLRGLMGTHWHLWGSLGNHWHLWGPLGTYGGLWGPMGTYGPPSSHQLDSWLGMEVPPSVRWTYEASCLAFRTNSIQFTLFQMESSQ